MPRQDEKPFSSSSEDYSLTLLTSPQDWDEPRLREQWDELIRHSGNVNAMYASPAWFDTLRETHDESDLLIAVLHNRERAVVGIVPVRFGQSPLQYDISSRVLFTAQLRTAIVLGSMPLIPEVPALFSKLYGLLLDSRFGCDGIYMDTVPVESACWRLAVQADRGSHLVYMPYGKRPWHLLQFGASANEYFSGMSSKTRYTLRKRVKRLTEHGGGKLELLRVECVEDVDKFVRGAVEVSRKTWQHKILGTRISDSTEQRSHFASLARRSLLRCYLLKCGDRPCAFVVGYQFDNVFHYNELGYDPDFSGFSPGTVLLYLLIQDLFAHRSPTVLNFGMGDADYKQRFGNDQKEEASLFVLANTWRNRLLLNSHSTFRLCVSTGRNLIRRRKQIYT